MSEIELLNQIDSELNQLGDSAYEAIQNTKNEINLEVLRVSFLGKKGKLSNILKNMGKLSENDRPIIGQKANLLKVPNVIPARPLR